MYSNNWKRSEKNKKEKGAREGGGNIGDVRGNEDVAKEEEDEEQEKKKEEVEGGGCQLRV